MRTDHVLCLGTRGYHRMQYYEWGDAANDRVVFCVHGLTRTGRDFDFLAQALAADFRVICPDVVGRGRSDWLQAKADYGYPQYMADMTALIARAGVRGTIDWIGTSMGGLIGMFIAALPNQPIARLVLNDVGMVVAGAGLKRLATYVGKDPRFGSIDALEAHVRSISAPFGRLSDAQWRHLTVHCARQHADGWWGFCYDPSIAHAFEGSLEDIDLSAIWDTVACPTLVLRGMESDLLRADTAQAMTQRGPKARLVEFENVGHAPALFDEKQVAVVRDFLLER